MNRNSAISIFENKLHGEPASLVKYSIKAVFSVPNFYYGVYQVDKTLYKVYNAFEFSKYFIILFAIPHNAPFPSSISLNK